MTYFEIDRTCGFLRNCLMIEILNLMLFCAIWKHTSIFDRVCEQKERKNRVSIGKFWHRTVVKLK